MGEVGSDASVECANRLPVLTTHGRHTTDAAEISPYSCRFADLWDATFSALPSAWASENVIQLPEPVLNCRMGRRSADGLSPNPAISPSAIGVAPSRQLIICPPIVRTNRAEALLPWAAGRARSARP